MRTKKLSATICVILILCLCSCNTAAELCPLDDYLSRYNERAKLFGFSEAGTPSVRDGVCGFAAFDGLFIVCLCVTEDGMIYSADISTGSEYAKLIKRDEKELEKALLSAAYLIAPLYTDEPSDEDISRLAGMVLAAIDEEKLKIEGGISLSGERHSGGGFEVSLSFVN